MLQHFTTRTPQLPTHRRLAMPSLNKTTEARLAFIVDYNDTQAGLVRKYQLCYYTSDGTIEMHDMKNRRMFLKRCTCAQVTPRSLYVGATITVYSRKLHVVGYADDATKQVYSGESESAVVAVPPASFDSLGDVLISITNAGLRIKNLNTLKLSWDEAEELTKGDGDRWSGHTMAAIEVLGSGASGVWKTIEEECNYGTWCCDKDSAQLWADWFFGQGSARSERSSAEMRDCTIAIVKPHAVAQHGGAIVRDILAEGFRITALKMLSLDLGDAADFFDVYKGVVPEFRAMAEQLSAGASWVIEIQGENPVHALRELCGPHDTDIAKVLRPHSLRAKYGTTRTLNALHCTDLPEDGETESDFFFNVMRPSSSGGITV